MSMHPGQTVEISNLPQFQTGTDSQRYFFIFFDRLGSGYVEAGRGSETVLMALAMSALMPMIAPRCSQMDSQQTDHRKVVTLWALTPPWCW